MIPRVIGRHQPGAKGASVEREVLLKEEYFKLQDIIESFDQRSLQIKGWSVTISLAGMAAALIAKDPTLGVKAIACLLSGLAALCFWMVDFSWKLSQQNFYARVEAIETAFAAWPRVGAASPLQTLTTFKASRFATIKDKWWRLFSPSVALPHVLVLAGGLWLGSALAETRDGSISPFGIKLQLEAVSEPARSMGKPQR